jgi:hypothetical protein
MAFTNSKLETFAHSTKYQLVISDRARDELETACQWWSENRSAQQAERWYDAFSEALLSVAKQHCLRFRATLYRFFYQAFGSKTGDTR